MALEGSVDAPGEMCDCGKGLRTTRCTECPTTTLKCDACYLSTHEDMPFHHAEKWNGFYFAKGSQSQLGRILYVGHGTLNSACPTKTKAQMITIVDVNGIHPSRMMYCTCQSPTNRSSTTVEKWRQLFRSGLVPASIKSPATACTVPMLKLHHLLNTIGKLSTMDFVMALRRMTNGSSPENVPVSVKPNSRQPH